MRKPLLAQEGTSARKLLPLTYHTATDARLGMRPKCLILFSECGSNQVTANLALQPMDRRLCP